RWQRRQAYAHAISPRSLRLIERSVGSLQHRARRIVIRLDGEADAHGDGTVGQPAAAVERHHIRSEALGDCSSFFEPRFGQANDELLAAEPPQKCRLAHLVSQTARYEPQRLVALRMTEAIVDLLEMIDIDDQQCASAVPVFEKRL